MHTQNIKMSILPFVLVLALLLPSNALAARGAADTVPVKAKFSRGGFAWIFPIPRLTGL